MEFIKNNTAELEATVIVKIEENDYIDAVNAELKKLRKTANLKGYRPGHVPPQVITRMFGHDVTAQEVSKLLDQKLKEYFEQEKIETIGDILPVAEETKFDVDTQKDFQFAFEFGMFPETKVDVETLKVPQYKIKIEDKTVEDEVVNLQKRYGDYVETEEAISEKTQIRADLVELNDDNSVKENGVVSEDNLIVLEYIDEETKKQLIGQKKDDKVVIDVKKSFKNDTDLAAVLRIEKTQLDSVNANFELTVKKVEEYKEGELNQEFFDKLFGKDEVKSVEDMKEKIREVIEKQYESESKIRFRYDLKNALEEAVEIPLPEEFIVKWQLDRRKDATEEEIRKEMDGLKKAIKWDRILNILSEEHNLQIEHKDLLDSSKANIINSLAQMGLSTEMFSDEQLDQFANQELERMNENDRYSLIFSTVERKVLDGLFEKVDKEEKEITIDELKNIYEEENKKIAESNKEENSDQTEDKE